MSTVLINGHLILNGDISCDGEMTVTSNGIVNPIPDPDTIKKYYSKQSNTYITANGKSRIMTSTTDDIIMSGHIDGEGYGFESDRGPGNNSLQVDSTGNALTGYGSSHAGLGFIDGTTLVAAPAPKPAYGNLETPISIGSGAGYYHNPLHIHGQHTSGGSGIKLVANSGTVSINGRINMNGQDGTNVGGASGGSIWVNGWNIDGTGHVSADGGSTLLTERAGGGGGGYIAMRYREGMYFDGTMTVDGYSGGGDGKMFVKELEPILEEPFTGSIWNSKWWDHTNSVAINNDTTFSLPDGTYSTPEVTSVFRVSGKEIDIEADYFPVLSDTSQYSAALLLYADSLNWVGVARKSPGFFGISAVNGIFSSSGVEYDDTNMSFRLLKNDGTFIFQYYDATSTPQTIYIDYLPELANRIFNVKLATSKASNLETLRTDSQRMTPLDISNQYVQLEDVPLDQTAVAMNPIKGSAQYYGTDFYVDGDKLKWDNTGSNFASLIAWGDVIRMIYRCEPAPTDGLTNIFDNVRVYEGIVSNAVTTEPVIYVDPDYGSDTCTGRQLEPLRNLFVATAWAKKGGTVVLYDGTHNPTAVAHKNLTLRGADGAIAAITTQNVQDTTGSGWETNALSFFGSQGIVDNIHILDSSRGIVVENGNYEITRNTITDTSNAVTFVNCDPVVTRNKILDVNYGLDFTDCRVPAYVYANVISNANVAVHAKHTYDMTFSGNTFDNDQTHFVLDSSTSVIVSSNNLTYSAFPVIASTDNAWFASYHNNFYPNAVHYNRPPDDLSGNIVANPLYYYRLNKDFHIGTASPNIGAGLLTYDNFYFDYDGADVRSADIGAFQYIDSTHITSDYYVTGHGNDYWNFGRQTDPFKTLDRAMVDASSTVHVDGGHYDTFYLKLRSQDIDLNQLYIYLGPEQLFISYITLSEEDVLHKYVPLPSFVEPDDAPYVAMNIVGSSAQVYGEDYIVEYGHILWNSYALDGFLAAGDTLRVIFYGTLQKRALNTYVLHGHYTDFAQEKAIYVSPSGSDSTVLGGDGTNTGGVGTRDLPYRTIGMALSQSSSGDHIVAMAGEYPVFNGLDDRVIVPAFDRTSVIGTQRCYEDFFLRHDYWDSSTYAYGPALWSYDYAGKSEVFAGGGFLNFTYDGTNAATAMSTFGFTGDFEVRASLRNAVDPIKFMVTSPDNTAFFSYNESQYSAGLIMDGTSIACGSVLNNGDTTEEDVFVVEYIQITADHTRNKYAPLSYIPEASDCTNLALNVVGGNTQDFGVDFYVEDSKIKWDGMTMDGEIEPGEVIRAVYLDRNLSLPVTASISLEDDRFTIRAFDGVWNTVYKRDLVGDYTGAWNVSFVMDTPNPAFSHNCIYGKGFASQFLAVTDSFVNIEGQDKPFATKTERRNVVIYEGRY